MVCLLFGMVNGAQTVSEGHPECLRREDQDGGCDMMGRRAVAGDRSRSTRSTMDYREAYEQLGPEYEVARALIEARTRAGLTQAELAARMKTTQSAAARLESGRTPPSTRTLEKVARARGLGCGSSSTASSKLSLERPNGRSRHPTRRWAAGPRSRRRNLWFSQVGQRQRCSPAPPIGYATGAPPVARPGRAAVWPLSADRQPGGRRPRSSPCRSVACVGAACGFAPTHGRLRCGWAVVRAGRPRGRLLAERRRRPGNS